MHRLWSTMALTTGVCAATAALGDTDIPHANEPQQTALEQARAATETLGRNLKAVLMTTVQNDGVAAAVRVCNEQAPSIHLGVSSELGLTVGRTGIRVRNPANAPDPWETQVLEDFATRLAMGEDPGALEHVDAAVIDGEPGWRYMRPIMTLKPCLACHGEALVPEVRGVIADRYPDDDAIGFREGELRGAFTVFIPSSTGGS